MKNSMRTLLMWGALIASTQACLAEVGKQDIKGFTTGMKFAEAHQLVKDRKYSCVSMSKEVIPYGISCEGVTLWFAEVLDGNPLIAAVTRLETNATTEEVVKSLSEQFSKSTVPIKQENGMIARYEWDLTREKKLRYYPINRSLDLIEIGLFEQEKQAHFRKSRVPVPKL